MSDMLWTNFFNLSNELLSVVSLQGKLLAVNQKWQQVLGYADDQLIGRSYLELLHADDLVRTAEAQAELERASLLPEASAKGRGGHELRNRYRHVLGHYLWLSWTAFVDREQKVIYLVGRECSREVRFEQVQQAMRRIQNAFLFSTERMLNPYDEMLAIINDIVGATASFVGIFNQYRKEMPYCKFLSYQCTKGVASPFREHALVHGVALASLRRVISEISKGKTTIDCVQDEQTLIPLPFLETHAEMNDFVLIPIQIGTEVLGLIGLGTHKNCSLGKGLEIIQPILHLCTELLVVERGKQREHSLRDILARKNRLLAQSHRMAKIGAWEIDAETEQLHLSDELYALLERRQDKKLSVSELILLCEAKSRPIFAKSMQRLMMHGESFNGEFAFVTGHEQEKWMKIIGRCVFDQHGRTTHSYGIIQDISEHKKMHALMIRQQEDLEALVTSLDDIIIELSVRDMVVRKIWAKDPLIFNLPTQKLEGQSCSAILPPAIWKALQLGLPKAMSLGVSIDEDVQFQEKRWVEIHINPIYTGDSEGSHCSVRIRDISQEKHNEQKSIEQLALLNTLADASPAIIWMSDTDGLMTYLNREWAEYTGILKEALGDGHWLQFLHSDDIAHAKETFEKALTDRKSFTNNYRIRRKDGEYHWFVNRGQPIVDHEGMYRGFVGTCLDINQQLRLEGEKQTLKRLIDCSPDLFCYCDESGYPLYLNEAAQHFFGWHNDVESIHEFISATEADHIMKDVWEIAANGEFWEGETLFRNKLLQEDVAVWLRVFALRDEQGRAQFFAMNAVDIRKKKETETQLLQASKMATLGEMAGGIAHEINNPLAIIQGVARKIKREVNHLLAGLESIQHDFSVLEMTSLRIAKIVKGLKTFARDGGSDPMVKTNLRTIIDDALALSQERFRDHGIQVIIENFDDTLLVNCRAVQISQALLNLLNNAHDAICDQDEKWINIQVDHSDDHVEIKVCDSGPGISAEVAAKIMQPFFTTKPIGKGTGLGLSIARGLIESHGGHLRYQPQAKTTCFVIELPRHLAATATQEVA